MSQGRNPFLPRTAPTKQKDPFLPVARQTNTPLPELADIRNFDLDTLVQNLLNLPYNVPTSNISVVAYIQTIGERMRMHGYNKLAEKWSKQLGEINKIVSAAASAQNARVQLLQYMIDERMLPDVHQKAWKARLKEEELRLFRAEKLKQVEEEEYEARIAEARKRKRLADED